MPESTVQAVSPEVADLTEDNQALLEELTRLHEEINWHYGLGRKIEREIQHQSLFAETLAYVGEVLPITKAEIWTPDRDSGVYRCLAHFDGSCSVKKLETIPQSEGSDHQLLNMGTCVLRDRAKIDSPEQLHVATLAESLGLPVVAMPLEAVGKLIGVVLFRFDPSGGQLLAPQLRLFEAIGRHLSLCLHLFLLIQKLRKDEGLMKELAIARQIQ